MAVLDTGIDAGHPQIQQRLAAGGWDFIDDDGNPSDQGDAFDSDGDGATDEQTGHGTFVAGLVTLVAPEASILPIRVLDGDGIGSAWTVSASARRPVRPWGSTTPVARSMPWPTLC